MTRITSSVGIVSPVEPLIPWPSMCDQRLARGALAARTVPCILASCSSERSVMPLPRAVRKTMSSLGTLVTGVSGRGYSLDRQRRFAFGMLLVKAFSINSFTPGVRCVTGAES